MIWAKSSMNSRHILVCPNHIISTFLIVAAQNLPDAAWRASYPGSSVPRYLNHVLFVDDPGGPVQPGGDIAHRLCGVLQYNEFPVLMGWGSVSLSKNVISMGKYLQLLNGLSSWRREIRPWCRCHLARKLSKGCRPGPRQHIGHAVIW